jgi:hypothetical protein
VHEANWDAQLKVYENTQVMPRAFVAYQARYAPTEAEEAALTARRDFDPHREIVLGAVTPRGQRLPPPSVENRGRLPSAAELVVHDRHRVVLKADAQAPGVLVLSDAFYAGWTATVDGKPAPILPVDLALRGVPLSTGPHRIEMTYRDSALPRGLLLSIAGLVGLALLALWGRAWRRQPSVAPAARV